MRLGLVGAATAALLLAGCGSPADGAGSGGTQAAAAQPAAIGEVIRVGDVEYTIKSVEQVQSVGDNPYLRRTASDGGTFVVVTFTVKNAGTRPVEFYDQATMHLVDANGVEYSSDPDATSAYQMGSNIDVVSFADINPGISVNDADVYQVSAEAFDLATWSVQIRGADRRAALR